MENGGLQGFAHPGAVVLQLVSEAWCIFGGTIKEDVSRGSICPRDTQAAAVGAGLAGPLGGSLDKASSNNGSLLGPAVLTLWNEGPIPASRKTGKALPWRETLIAELGSALTSWGPSLCRSVHAVKVPVCLFTGPVSCLS